jgi:hypothetical protein
MEQMENLPGKRDPRSLLAGYWPWLVLLAIILFTGFIRFRLLETPLERDEGEYAYAGQLILQGIPPYELAYNMKLPGTYYAYALGMAVFGQTTAGVHLTLLVVNTLTIIFVFLLARKLFGVTAGLVAGAGYAVMAASPAVLGIAGHANHFVVLFGVPGMLLSWRAAESGRRRFFFLGGLLFGLAFLMKQQGICFGLAGLAFLVWDAVSGRAALSRDFLLKVLIFAAGMALPLVLSCLSCVAAGDFGRFWFWTYTRAGTYAVSLPVREGATQLNNYLSDNFQDYAGYWLVALAGMVVALRMTRFRREIFLTLALLFFSFLGTAAGLYFRPHYFILLLPALAILVGGAVVLLQTAFSQKGRIIAPVVFAAVTGWLVYQDRVFFFGFTPSQYCEAVYQGNPLIEAVDVAQYLRTHSKPDDRIAVIGSEPQIYFYSGRHSATGYIYGYPLMETRPVASVMQREMIDEIEASKPEFIVLVMYKFSWLAHPQSDKLIFRWAGIYTRQFYDRVGIIGRQSDGKIGSVNGGDAGSARSLFEQYIVVYQRKAGPGTARIN